jgi:hypothetical protein
MVAAAEADSFRTTEAQIAGLTAKVSKKSQNRWQRFNSGARYIVVGSTRHLDAPLAEAFLQAAYSSLVPQRASRSQMPYVLVVLIATTVDASAVEWARSVPHSQVFQVVVDASTAVFCCEKRLWDTSRRGPRRLAERYVLPPLRLGGTDAP